MRKIQLCSTVLHFMDKIDPGNESQSKYKVRITSEYAIWKWIYTENFTDQDDNVGCQDRSLRKKLQGGPSEQRDVGSFTQTETRTAGSISEC